MADPLIYVLLEQLSSITYHQIEKKVRLVLTVKKEVAKITSNLKAIQAVLEDAEQRQAKEAVVRDWLEKLKDVSYEMEDVLDEWSTEILIQEIEEQQKVGEHNLVIKKKVCFSIPSHCFCFGQVSRVIYRRDIALMIKHLNDRLKQIEKERKMFNFQITERRSEQPHESLKTSSFVNTSKTFGRDDEKNFTVSRLLSEGSPEKGWNSLTVIPIVGMGGMGKTTLAQLAFNDGKVQAHFEMKIWVCVSDPFDVIKIAKAIIVGTGNATPNSEELEFVLQCMSESIKGKKLLLVLDDVWNEDRRKWEQLELPLQNSAIESRILVTTRKDAVAIVMGAKTRDMVHLKQLSEQCCWSLFHHTAFFDMNKNESDAFEAVGKEIVRKCKGLPLAAKTLGSLMRFKKTRKEWQEVLHSDIWELEKFEQEVYQPLLLSYYDLESAMRRCLLYCAIFPKDWVFEKDNLIELWMSQSYLTIEGSREKEEIGKMYFDNLVMRSFFQDLNRDDDGNIVCCKMHDIVHDFVQFLSRKESFIFEANDAKKTVKPPAANNIRHLTLMVPFEDLTSFHVPFGNCKSLRTLMRLDLKLTALDSEILLQLKRLRTLNLSGNNMSELPREISQLVHLRYLDLSHNTSLKELPNSMCNLYNLQTLRLKSCFGLEKLPEDMGKLINLRHLHVKGCQELKRLPKGIGRLADLQTLTGVTVCGDNEYGAFKLGDLRNLDQLRGTLFIKELRNVKDASEADEAKLRDKKHILRLDLNFKFNHSDLSELFENQEAEQRTNDEEILNALQPHEDLEFLMITHYDGATVYPNWMTSLNNLKKLCLRYFKYCENLPPVGRLPSLEILSIEGMPRLRKIGVEFLGIQESTQPSTRTVLFPRLKELLFLGMSLLEEWEGVGGCSGMTIMPLLSFLTIRNSNLRTLPDYLQKTPLLDTFMIEECPFLQRVFLEGTGKEWSKISHIPNIFLGRKTVQRDGVLIRQESIFRSNKTMSRRMKTLSI